MPSINFSPCCDGCCTKICIQFWRVSWNCVTRSYSAKSALSKICYTIAHTEGEFDWNFVERSGNNCIYEIKVPMGTCCTVDGDCTGLPNTPEPANPPATPEFLGSCYCCVSCPSGTPCAQCDYDTPASFCITLASIKSCNCIVEAGVVDCDIYKVNVDGLDSVALTFTQDLVLDPGGCAFTADVTAFVHLLWCRDPDCVGGDPCGGCEPDTDLITGTATWVIDPQTGDSYIIINGLDEPAHTDLGDPFVITGMPIPTSCCLPHVVTIPVNGSCPRISGPYIVGLPGTLTYAPCPCP